MRNSYKKYMSRFIETLRVEKKAIPLLRYHLMRAGATCDFHNISCPLNEGLISEFVNDNIQSDGIYKLRIVYGKEIYSMEVSPYHLIPVTSLKVVECPSVAYSFKYADRQLLSSLYDWRDVNDDVLITKNGWITDTYYCNIAFFNGDTWFTPNTPLLNGTRRSFLIDQGIISVKAIKAEDIRFFSGYKLFNAMIAWEESTVLSTSTIAL